VRIVRAGQDLIQTSVYTIKDDVARITRMTKATKARVIDSTTVSPGLVSDPVCRACAGGRWSVPSVNLVCEGSTSARAIEAHAEGRSTCPSQCGPSRPIVRVLPEGWLPNHAQSPEPATGGADHPGADRRGHSDRSTITGSTRVARRAGR
jgi:hypothetical protein